MEGQVLEVGEQGVWPNTPGNADIAQTRGGHSQLVHSHEKKVLE